MSELIPISALIGDRTYRIKIRPEDEEIVRRTLKTINDRIIDFKTQFAGKDMQDYVAMVLVWFATQQQAGGQGDTGEILKELAELEKLLEGKA